MKILHVITSLRTGGAEKLMVDLLPRMASKGHEVELCVFDGVRTAFYDELERKGIKIHHFHINGSVYNPLNIIRLRRLMNRGWDVVHSHNTAPQLFAAICSSLSAFPLCGKGKPLMVTTEHNTTNRRRAWGWYRAVDNWMYSRYKTVICISEKTRDWLIDAIPQVSKKTVVINNGIDVASYASAKPLDEKTKDGQIILTMVAAFRPQKDQDTVIRAIQMLPDNYVLWLVGGGERKAEVEQFVENLDLQNRVIFKGLRTDVPRILKTSHIVVMSSHWEGFGLAAAEGMAAGKPVIATDVPGLAEVVDNADLLFQQGDEKTLAAKIKQLSEDEDYYKSIARQCQAKAAQYDINVMADKYLGVYTALADSKG